MALIHNNITCKSTESQLLIYHTYNEIPTTNHIQFHRLTLNINLFTVFNLQNSFWSTNTSCWNISPKLFLHHPFNRIVNNPKSQTIKLYKTTQPSGKKKYTVIYYFCSFFFSFTRLGTSFYQSLHPLDNTLEFLFCNSSKRQITTSNKITLSLKLSYFPHKSLRVSHLAT